MMIEEIETLSGIERAGIRFYEREGLIAPERLDNEYRDYTENNFKYLAEIRRVERETGSAYFTVRGDIIPQAFYPGRRFFARIFDLFICSVLWSAFC